MNETVLTLFLKILTLSIILRKENYINNIFNIVY